MFILGGIIGSVIFGIWVEIKKTYKIAVISITILSILSVVGTTVSFIMGISWIVVIFCFIVGFSTIPIMAIGFELGVEVTYPIDESYSTGILMLSGELFGIISTAICSTLIDKYKKTGCIIGFAYMIATLTISFVLAFFIKEDLRRYR